MVYFEGCIFIAIFCAVNAAVTDNIYKDDLPAVKLLVHEVESCETLSCNQLCKRLGFNMGKCDGDTCECSKSLHDETRVNNKIEGQLRCNTNTCNQICRRLGFLKGECVDDHCRCENFLRLKERLPEDDNMSNLDRNIIGDNVRGCNPSACNQVCQRLNFPGGTCINGKCKCYNYLQDTEQREYIDIVTPSLTEDVIAEGMLKCNPAACNQLCQRLKFPGGVCVNGRCKCDNFLQREDQLQQNELFTSSRDIITENLRGCNPSACNQLCQRLKFPGGVCVNGRCKCDNFLQKEEQLQQNELFSSSLNTDIITNNLHGCNPMACKQLCQRLKFPGGVCVNGRCKCDNFLQNEEQLQQNELFTSSQDIITENLRGCNPSACDQLCRRLKFPGGVCVNGRCKCDNFREAEDLIVPSYDPEIFDEMENSVDRYQNNEYHDCDQLACYMGCRSIGFPGGRCFIGKCRCGLTSITQLLVFLSTTSFKSLCGWCRFGEYQFY